MMLGDKTWLARKMDAAVTWGNKTSGADNLIAKLSPEPPKLPEAPKPPPDLGNEVVQAAQRMERLRNARMGRSSTFLTGPQGARPISSPPKNSLLGG
jgi:hypothetical protein